MALRWAALVGGGLILFGVGYAVAGGGAPGRIVSVAVPALSFFATGLLAWHRRPANRTGRLLVAIGVCFALGAVRGLPVLALAPIGLLGSTAADVLLGYLILAFPSGELRSPGKRTLVVATAALLLVPRAVSLAGLDPAALGVDAVNPYLVIRDRALVGTVSAIEHLIDVVILLTYLGILVFTWTRATGPGRRAISPVLIPFALLVAAILAATVVNVSDFPRDLQVLLSRSQDFARAAIPVGIVVGLLRMRMARSAVADLVFELGEAPAPERLRDALANALRDPSLTVVHWSAEATAYLDEHGREVALPRPASGRAATLLERDGEPLAAILHDPALLGDPGLVSAVASALRLAVENERLHAEVQTQLAEVRASRARIVEAGDAERKRVERDLHDGAQQRLVALTLALRLARTRLGDDVDPAIRLGLEQASDEAKAALAELRELARGIHPQILTEAGLAAAVETLADRSPVDVVVDLRAGRFSPAAEGAAYFVISEALANVAKYAQAKRALVRTGWQDERLTVEISDDGVGGADPASGSGLRGLIDRLAAVDGTLEIFSPRGGGTRLVARIPTAALAPEARAGS